MCIRDSSYAIVPNEAALLPAMKLVQTLRREGVSVQMHAAGANGLGSMKSQFKKADASGARYALVFGESELAAGEVVVKSLRDGQGGAQVLRALDTAADWAASLRA